VSVKRIFSKEPIAKTVKTNVKEGNLPNHIAVIMDGNGRWARKRLLPRVAGHKRGVEVVRDLVKQCAKLNIQYLTLFAFSSENWRRPQEEVSFLMGLFMQALKREVAKLHENNIRLKLIGDRSAFSEELITQIDASLVYALCTRAGSVYSYWRRTTDQQLSFMAVSVHRALFYGRALARF